MYLVRGLITTLVLALVAISLLGIFWWDAPPEKLAASGASAKILLGTLSSFGLISLYFLWRRPDPNARL